MPEVLSHFPIFANLARVCEEEQIAPKRQLPFCLQNLFSASLSYKLSEVVFLLSLTRQDVLIRD